MSEQQQQLDELGNDLAADQVYLVKRSLIGFGWACAPKHMTVEQVQEAVLAPDFEQYIENVGKPVPWTVAPREHADPTLQSPGRCAECEDRQHWFLIGGTTGIVLLAMSDDYEGFPPGLKAVGLDEDEQGGNNV